MHRARLKLTLGVVLAAGLLLAGCGLSGLEIVAGAPDKTINAKTSKFAINVNVTNTTTAQNVQLAGDGTFDFAAKRGNLSLTIPGIGRAGAPTKVLSVIMGDVVYQRYPPEIARRLPGRKPWLKVDVAAARKRGGDANALAQGQSNDPLQAVSFLRGVSGDDVKTVGEKEDVRGTRTTHYRAEIDLNKAAEKAGTSRPAVEAFSKQLAVTRLPAEIWIDGEGRVRRMRYEVQAKVGQAGANQPAKVQTTVELFDFGTRVQADPPPGGQVTDVNKLLSK